MNIEYYWPKAEIKTKAEAEEEDKISATYVRMMCANPLSIGAVFKRPLWHYWVYGGGKNPNL